MGAAIKFQQGIPLPLAFSNSASDDGQVDQFYGFTGVFQIRRSIDYGKPLFEKSTAAGTLSIELIDGAWTINVPFEIEDTAAMVPVVPLVPELYFDDDAPAYRLGVWELRLTSADGVPFSLVRGPAFIEVAVVRI